MWLQALVATPAVQNMSLTAMGIPSSGRASPLAIRASAVAAMVRALSAVSTTKALSERARDCQKVGIGKLDCGEFLVRQRRARFSDREGGEIGHAAIGSVMWLASVVDA